MRLRIQGFATPIVLALGVSASGHLLVRGTPLSELAATSAASVVGRVQSVSPDGERRAVTLEVERALTGAVPAGTLRFVTDGHHPPDYQVGARVLVFLTGTQPRWVSRQSELDRVELSSAGASSEALFAAVSAWAALGGVQDREERSRQLKALGFEGLESPSRRVRREALLDLMDLAAAGRLDAEDAGRVATRVQRPGTPDGRAAGLVTLLAAMPGATAEPALISVLGGAPSPRARALAAQVVGQRRSAAAVPSLAAALTDPALEVRLSARRALDRIATPAAREALQGPSSEPGAPDLESSDAASD